MSQGEYEKSWMAYLDGQLSAGEAASFDDSLDDAGRARIEGELQLEAALADKLCAGEACPADLWRNTLAQLQQPAPRKVVPFRRAAALAAAAAILMTVGAGFSYVYGAPEAPGTVDVAMPEMAMARLAISEETVSDFALRAKTPCSPKAIERFLEEHNIQLAVSEKCDSPAAQQHRVRLLGSCMGNCPKGEIVEVLFDFDGTPAKLVLARASSGGAKLIRKEEQKGTVLRTRVVGDYLAGVVFRGENPKDTDILLDMIREKNEQIARRDEVNQTVSTVV
ncbi:MAG: hypothetical protein RLZZ303_1196 [Candidatus Hydrogenedentota bacterium]|jgi:hypothetical protein